MKIKNLIIVMFLFVIMQCSCHKSKIKDEENLVLTIKLNETGRVSSLIESATGYVDAAASYCPEDHNLWQNTVNSRNKKESLKMLCPIEWERELVVSLSGTWSGNKLDRFRVLAPDGKVLLDELLEKRDPGVKKIVIDTSKLPPPRGKP